MTKLSNFAAALLGLLATAAGVWAMVAPRSFSEAVNFAPHQHYVHDAGAFQFGIEVTLLPAMIWADALAAALAGYLAGATAHTTMHLVDAQSGGSTVRTAVIGLLALLAATALVARWRALGWIVGRVDAATTQVPDAARRPCTVRASAWQAQDGRHRPLRTEAGRDNRQGQTVTSTVAVIRAKLLGIARLWSIVMTIYPGCRFSLNGDEE